MATRLPQYLYDPWGRDIAYFDAGGGTWLNSMVPLGGRTLASYPGSYWGNVMSFSHVNALGSGTYNTSYNGAATGESLFYPWGQSWVSEGLFASFSDVDRGANIYAGRARNYNYIHGRWLNPDPLAGDVTNPQSLNRYAYVLNNPTTLTDPSGLGPPGCPSGMDTRWCYGGIPGFWAGGTQMFAFSSPTWNMFQQLQQSTSGTVTYEWKLNGNWDEVSEIYGSYYNVEDNFQTYWTLGEVDTTSSNWTWDSSMVSSMGYAIDNAYGKALGKAGQFFRGRPPGQSFAACVGQNMSRTFTLSPNHPISTTVTAGVTGSVGLGLGLPEVSVGGGSLTLAELGTALVSHFAGVSTATAVSAGFVASDAAFGAGLIGLAPFVGSAANCASVGVAP